MRLVKFLTAATTSVALMVAPAVAAPTGVSGQLEAAARASAAGESGEDLFRTRGRQRRGGGILALILIAAIIALGVYIITDDDDNEAPASP